MAKIFDTYCANVDSLEAARALIEAAMPVRLVLHESMYWGGLYYLAETKEYGRIAVRPNFNSFTGKLNESRFPSCRFIVSVSKPADPDALKSQLVAAGIEFLERNVV